MPDGERAKLTLTLTIVAATGVTKVTMLPGPVDRKTLQLFMKALAGINIHNNCTCPLTCRPPSDPLYKFAPGWTTLSRDPCVICMTPLQLAARTVPWL